MNGAVLSKIRVMVLQVSRSVGNLSFAVDSLGFESAVTSILVGTLNIATALGVDVFAACNEKMELNQKKYRKDLCQDQVRFAMRSCPSALYMAASKLTHGLYLLFSDP